MTFLQLPTDLHTSLLLEWLPCKVLSTLDVALSERRYWLELLRSPVLMVDPPFASTPDRSYHTWLESRQLKVATLRVNMALMPGIKIMRFPSVRKVAAVLSNTGHIKEARDLADFLEANRNIGHISIRSDSCLGHFELTALAKHKLDLKVLDMRGSAIDRSGQSAGGIFAVLYQLGSSLEELRLAFGSCQSDALKEHHPDIMRAITQHCRRLTKLQFEGGLVPIKAIHMLCERNRNITELRCCVAVTAPAEAASACQEVLERLPKLEHLSLTGTHKTRLPTLAWYPCLQSIVTDEGCINLDRGSIAINRSVTAARALEILIALPNAMRYITCGYQSFSGSAILQVAHKHSAQVEQLNEISIDLMTALEWQQLWATCPRLIYITTAQMELNLSSLDFYFLCCRPLTAREAMDILLTVPVPLWAIHIENDAIRLTPAHVLAVAAKHGTSLKNFGLSLNVAEFGMTALQQFFQLYQALQCIDLSHADADSLQLVAKHCTSKMTKLTVRDEQQRVTDAALIAVLQVHKQMTELTLIDCTAVTSAVLDHIGSLVTLKISGNCAISKFDLVEALDAGKLSNLTKLCLNWSDAQLLYIETIFKLAYKNKHKTSILERYDN